MRRRRVWYGKCVVRSGTQGMKWGHRYHQDYITKPTRSGMVGEVHFTRDVDHDKRLTDSEQDRREKKQEKYINNEKRFENNRNKLNKNNDVRKVFKNSSELESYMISGNDKLSEKEKDKLSKEYIKWREEENLESKNKYINELKNKSDLTDNELYELYSLETGNNIFRDRKTGKYPSKLTKDLRNRYNKYGSTNSKDTYSLKNKIKNKFSRKLDPAFDNYTKIKYNAKQDKIMSNEEEMDAFKNKNIFEHIDNKKDLIEAAAKYSYLYGRSPHNTNSDYYRGQTGKIDENKVYKSLNKKERNKINEIMVSERDRGERDRSESSNKNIVNKLMKMDIDDRKKAIIDDYPDTKFSNKDLEKILDKRSESSNKLNDESLNKALDLWNKSRNARTGEESDHYERQFDKYLGDKKFQKALNNLSPDERKEYDKMFKPY